MSIIVWYLFYWGNLIRYEQDLKQNKPRAPRTYFFYGFLKRFVHVNNDIRSTYLCLYIYIYKAHAVYGDPLYYKILNVLCDIYMIWILQAAKVFAIYSFGKYVYKCIRCMIIIEQKVKLEINHIHVICIHRVCVLGVLCIVFCIYLVLSVYPLVALVRVIWFWYRKRECLLNYTILMYL